MKSEVTEQRHIEIAQGQGAKTGDYLIFEAEFNKDWFTIIHLGCPRSETERKFSGHSSADFPMLTHCLGFIKSSRQNPRFPSGTVWQQSGNDFVEVIV